MFISGPEHNVLARYVEAQRITNADYIVRLTSDCPLMLDYVIGKAINMCIFKQRDYVSNVEEACRTFADGYDVECMSKAALDWLNVQAYSDIDREHVTSMIRRVRPRHLTQGVIMSKIDTSETHSLGFKMSLDTPEDFHRIQNYYERAEFKMKEAIRIFGEKHVYLL
jgi:spore coat polysaccharide biosynthesis protein SpsF